MRKIDLKKVALKLTSPNESLREFQVEAIEKEMRRVHNAAIGMVANSVGRCCYERANMFRVRVNRDRR